MKLAARERRLIAVLSVLAGIVLLRLLYGAATPPAPAASAARPAAGSKAQRGRAARAAELPTAVVALELAAFERQPRDLSFGRDPFLYGPHPPPPPPPPPTREELARMAREAEARKRAAELAAREALIPKPPPVTLKYLGSFGPETRRVAVFADQAGENLYNARTGEVLEGKFIVDRIGYESVDLKFVDFPDEPAARLPIGG